jgi:putative oxidoreductase
MPDALRAYSPIPLRLIAAVGFLYHGIPKFTPEGHQEFLTWLQGLSVPVPGLASWVVAAVEVGGGLLLLIGWMVHLAVLPLIIDMLVATVTVHWSNGFNFIHITGMTPQGPTFGMPGYEVPLLYIAILVSLWLSGAGAWSMDERATIRVTPVGAL